MKIRLNGEERELLNAVTIGEMVGELQLPERALLIEHNGVALHRGEWAETKVADGDQVEVLRVVAGG